MPIQNAKFSEQVLLKTTLGIFRVLWGWFWTGLINCFQPSWSCILNLESCILQLGLTSSLIMNRCNLRFSRPWNVLSCPGTLTYYVVQFFVLFWLWVISKDLMVMHINTIIGFRKTYSYLLALFFSIHVFFIRKCFVRKWASNTVKLKKVLRKSPASNAWAIQFLKRLCIFPKAL